MSKEISFTVPDEDYQIIKEYAEHRGHARVGHLARRATYRMVNQNPLNGKRLGDYKRKVDRRIYYVDGKNEGWVYFITCVVDGTKYCKIGRSLDVEKRFNDLDSQVPAKLSLFKKIRVSNCMLAEAAFHSFYNDKRYNGEWFNLAEKDYAQIEREGLSIVTKPENVNMHEPSE